MLAFGTSTEGVHGEILQVLGIVVLARRESIETSGQPINGGIKIDIIIIREDDVEISIEL